jgi:hypothetical protein
MNDVASIELDVTLEFRDYLRVNFWFFLRKLKFLLALLLIAMLYPLLTAIGLMEGSERDNYWGLLIPFGFFALLFGANYYGARRYWESNASIRETKRYTLTERGIDVAGPTAGGYSGWENVREAFEKEHSFILFVSTQETYIIPKRFFDGGSQIEAFRDLLRRRLPRKAKLK